MDKGLILKQKISSFCIEKGITKKQFAEDIGVHYQAMWYWFKGGKIGRAPAARLLEYMDGYIKKSDLNIERNLDKERRGICEVFSK